MRKFAFGDRLRSPQFPLRGISKQPVKDSEKNMSKVLVAVLLAGSMVVGATVAHAMGGGGGGGGGATVFLWQPKVKTAAATATSKPAR